MDAATLAAQGNQARKEQNTNQEWVNKSCYADPVAKIVFDTKSSNKKEKKTE
jgi:hypothetical protein